jgi:hypothetical protein
MLFLQIDGSHAIVIKWLLLSKIEAGMLGVLFNGPDQRVPGKPAPSRNTLAGRRIVGPHFKHLTARQAADRFPDLRRQRGASHAGRIEDGIGVHRRKFLIHLGLLATRRSCRTGKD